MNVLHAGRITQARLRNPLKSNKYKPNSYPNSRPFLAWTTHQPPYFSFCLLCGLTLVHFLHNSHDFVTMYRIKSRHPLPYRLKYHHSWPHLAWPTSWWSFQHHLFPLLWPTVLQPCWSLSFKHSKIFPILGPSHWLTVLLPHNVTWLSFSSFRSQL